MSELRLSPLPAFVRDTKRLLKRHANISKLQHVLELIKENSAESKQELEQRHNMHMLKGAWKGHHECHVCNAGDWLIIWIVDDGIAFLERTGSHEELFK